MAGPRRSQNLDNALVLIEGVPYVKSGRTLVPLVSATGGGDAETLDGIDSTGFELAGASAAAVAAHVALGDPHTQYLTAAEGDAAFLTPAEGAALITAHEAAGNPHPVYLTDAEGDALFLTPAEADAAFSALLHAAQHQNGGGDEISVAGLSGLLADAQTPVAHATSHQPGGSDAMAVDAVAATGSLRTLGTGAQQAAPGNHTHAGGTAFEMTTVEKDLGATARRSGTFTITGAGLVAGKPVLIQQAVGPYTGKGTRADEAEMDQVLVTAAVVDATTIRAYWKSEHFVRGNYKWNYAVSA